MFDYRSYDPVPCTRPLQVLTLLFRTGRRRHRRQQGARAGRSAKRTTRPPPRSPTRSLQRADVPFRIGHHFASKLTDYGRGRGLRLSEIPYAEAARLYGNRRKQAFPFSEAELRGSDQRRVHGARPQRHRRPATGTFSLPIAPGSRNAAGGFALRKPSSGTPARSSRKAADRPPWLSERQDAVARIAQFPPVLCCVEHEELVVRYIVSWKESRAARWCKTLMQCGQKGVRRSSVEWLLSCTRVRADLFNHGVRRAA
jgi:hypothetical protein